MLSKSEAYFRKRISFTLTFFVFGNNTVHTTTDELKTMLIVTKPTKKTSTLLSTQPLPIQNSTIGIYFMKVIYV